MKELREEVLAGKQIFHMKLKDAKRICHVAELHGIILSEEQAVNAWRDFSASYCASWLVLPTSDEDLWKQAEEYVKMETSWDRLESLIQELRVDEALALVIKMKSYHERQRD